MDVETGLVHLLLHVTRLFKNSQEGDEFLKTLSHLKERLAFGFISFRLGLKVPSYCRGLRGCWPYSPTHVAAGTSPTFCKRPSSHQCGCSSENKVHCSPVTSSSFIFNYDKFQQETFLNLVILPRSKELGGQVLKN